MRNNITFVIFTYNEEARIERVIKNFIKFGNVLLADDHSTDKTREIALSYGCEILLRQKSYVFVENQEMVDQIYAKITTDWIYWGFADEMMGKETLSEIEKIINGDQYDIINIDRKNYFYGAFCYDIYNAYVNKIFKKGSIDFTDNVIHGMGKAVVAQNRIYKMPGKYFVHHFISNNAASYLNVINRYTDTEIEFDHKPQTSVVYFIWLAVKYTLKDFFIKRGYRAGYKGLAVVELMLFYHLVKNMKQFEKQNNLTTASIEDKNNVFRDSIIANL